LDSEIHVLWAWSESIGFAWRNCPGVLEYWRTGVLGSKIEDSEVFSVLVFALLHYSITPLLQRNSEIRDTMSPF